MNTPAHVVTNLLVLGRSDRPERAWPIAAGGVLPDAPMFLFYAVEKARGATETQIWGERYFEPGWRLFFDMFNSLPLLALGLLIAWRLAAGRWMALLISMGLHCLFDLPLHQADDHRHFFPLSDWKFLSPVSYWDPTASGSIVTLVEVALVLIGSVVLWKRWTRAPHRLLVAALGFAYLAYFGYVILVWL